MTTDQFNAKRAEIEDADDRMAGLVAAFACALASLTALAFTFAFMSPK